MFDLLKKKLNSFINHIVAKEEKKPTAEECKKAAEAKKELAGCEKEKAKK